MITRVIQRFRPIGHAFLLGLMLSQVGCDRQEPSIPSMKQQPAPTTLQQPMPSTTPALYLHYATNGESHYTDIRVEQGILTYTYFDDTEHRCDQWFKSTPCWAPADLKTITRPLDTQQTTELQQLVASSGLLALTESLFGAKHLKQRAYHEILDVKVGEDERHLVYRSRPDAEPKPAAFQQVEAILQLYAQQYAQTLQKP